MENPYFITLEAATREAIEKEGYRMIPKDPATDPDLQAAQIQEMIDEGIDAIFLCPVDWEAITPSLKALKDIRLFKIILNSFTQNNDFICIFRSHFLSKFDIFRTKSRFPFISCPIQSMDCYDTTFSE